MNPFAEMDDDTLMLAYADRGELEAFDTLYGRYRRPLYRYLLAHLPKANADEVYQETWAGLIGHKHQYRGQGQFKNWLFSIAHNKLVDLVRQKRFLPLDDAFAGAIEDTNENATDPLRQLSNLEHTERLRASLTALPFHQREAVLLKQQGFGVEEIAAITRVDFEAIKSRLRYAFKKLRAEWGDDHD